MICNDCVLRVIRINCVNWALSIVLFLQVTNTKRWTSFWHEFWIFVFLFDSIDSRLNSIELMSIQLKKNAFALLSQSKSINRLTYRMKRNAWNNYRLINYPSILYIDALSHFIRNWIFPFFSASLLLNAQMPIVCLFVNHILIASTCYRLQMLLLIKWKVIKLQKSQLEYNRFNGILLTVVDF